MLKMTFVTMALVILALVPSEGSNVTLPLDGLRTAIFVEGRLNWSSNLGICKEKYTDLVTIYDEKENKLLSNFCTIYPKIHTCFIGLKKGNDAFKWSNGDPYNYTKITSTDTNTCVAMMAHGEWESAHCSKAKPFICYSDEPVNFSRYHLITELKNWYDAVSYCRENFTDLVSIRNDEQNSEVLNVKGNHPNNTWIGLMRDSWEWSDKGLSLYRKWAMGQPNLSKKFVGLQNEWKTFNEHSNMGALCYKDHIHISSENMTWEDSHNYCQSFNGSFCILNKLEQVAAERLMRRLDITEPVWVGLQQIWTTEVKVDYSNWEGGQSRSHHCGALGSAKDDFKWKAMNCTTKLRALCLDLTV